jgi:hypothetical protein
MRRSAVALALAVLMMLVMLPAPARAQGCVGMSVTPAMSLQATFDAYPEGTTFCLSAGTWRITERLLPKTGQVLHGEPGTIVSGAKVLMGWRFSAGKWYKNGQTQQTPPEGSCFTANLCNYNEWLYRDGQWLSRVGSRAAVTADTWFFDYAADRIWIGASPVGHTFEASVSPGAIGGNYPATDVRVEGLTFEKIANTISWGAAKPGVRWTLDGVTVRQVHGTAIAADYDAIAVINSKALDNGATGMGGYRSTNNRFENNEITGNQHLLFNDTGDATKWARTVNLTVRNNILGGGVGNGLWLDTGNDGALVEGNTVHDQTGIGIVSEVDCTVTIRNNTSTNNGGDGLQVVDSRNADVWGNTVQAPSTAGGIVVWHQGRESTDCPGGIASVAIHDNDVTMAANASGLLVCCGGTSAIFTAGTVTFAGNHYHVPDPAGAWWQWLGSPKTWAQWQGYGHDLLGSVD